MKEFLRSTIRGFLGYDSWLYRLAAATLNNVTTVVSEGPKTFFTLRRLDRLPPKKSAPVAVKFRRLSHPILLRPGTEDISAVVNNIVREEYGHLQLEETPETLIDAGAYIGDTSAYFLSRFPTLQSIALEPNPESYKELQRNQITQISV